MIYLNNILLTIGQQLQNYLKSSRRKVCTKAGNIPRILCTTDNKYKNENIIHNEMMTITEQTTLIMCC